MKKIVAFGASSSKKSINKLLASYVANQIKQAEVKILDLNDYEMPIYSIDRESDSGIPEKANQFKKDIRDADGLVVSSAVTGFAYMDGKVVGHLAVPKFSENFSDEQGLLDENLKVELGRLLLEFQSAL